MNSGSLSVWEKFDIDEYKENRMAAATLSSPIEAGSRPQDSRWGWVRNRSFWAALTVFASIFWIYVPLKLFVGDVDRWIVTRVGPSWLWILDFRFFVLLPIMTVVIVITKRWMAAAILLYIFFFPVVVLVWKIPRLYYRS